MIIEYEGILEDVLAKFLPVLASILVAAITAGLAAVSSYFVRKIKNEKLRGSMDHLRGVTLDVVLALMQSQVEEIKKASADGKLTDDYKSRLKQVALETIVASATDEALSYLRKKKVDLDKLLDALVESSIYQVKNGGKS